MEDKIVDAVDKNAAEIGQRTPIQFDYADFKMRCSCGNIQTIDEKVKGLLQFNMYTTDMHNMLLVCPACNHELELFFTEAEAPVQEEDPSEEVVKEEKDEPVQETSKTEE